MKVRSRSGAGSPECCFTLCVCFCVPLSLNPNENPLGLRPLLGKKLKVPKPFVLPLQIFRPLPKWKRFCAAIIFRTFLETAIAIAGWGFSLRFFKAKTKTKKPPKGKWRLKRFTSQKSLKCRNPLFYRCKCFWCCFLCLVSGFLVKHRLKMKLPLRSGAGSPECCFTLCVCFCVPPLWTSMRTLRSKLLLGKKQSLTSDSDSTRPDHPIAGSWGLKSDGWVEK